MLNKDITLEEAEEKLKALNLTMQEAAYLLKYFKTCWNISGSEEFSKAMIQAHIYTNIYNQQEIEGIDNEVLRKRIMLWEEEHKASQ